MIIYELLMPASAPLSVIAMRRMITRVSTTSAQLRYVRCEHYERCDARDSARERIRAIIDRHATARDDDVFASYARVKRAQRCAALLMARVRLISMMTLSAAR